MIGLILGALVCLAVALWALAPAAELRHGPRAGYGLVAAAVMGSGHAPRRRPRRRGPGHGRGRPGVGGRAATHQHG